MRVGLVLILSIFLLLSVSAMASAEVFRITPEVMDAELETNSYSESGNIYFLSGDLNFILLRTGVDLGYGEIDDTEFTMTGVRIGTEIPLVLFKLIAFGGYQAYKMEYTNSLDEEIKGTVLGAGLEYKLNNFFSLRGVVTRSMKMERDNNDEKIDFTNAKLDLIFTTAPLVDFYIGYRTMEFEDESDGKLELSGLTAGMRLGI
jgi:hypothetical protein